MISSSLWLHTISLQTGRHVVLSCHVSGQRLRKEASLLLSECQSSASACFKQWNVLIYASTCARYKVTKGFYWELIWSDTTYMINGIKLVYSTQSQSVYKLAQLGWSWYLIQESIASHRVTGLFAYTYPPSHLAAHAHAAERTHAPKHARTRARAHTHIDWHNLNNSLPLGQI